MSLSLLKVLTDIVGGVVGSMVIVALLPYVPISNALFPILVTPSGIVMLVREKQEEKALFPILVTVLGIVMLVREEQEEKA